MKPPLNWKLQYDKIKAFRKNSIAPVDTMGCERLSDTSDPIKFRFQTLVSLMLSSQTKDPINADAMNKLQNMPVGYHNKKVDYLSRTAKILKDEYNGDIPDNLEGLLKLPGVGPKMAFICLQITKVAWGKNEGIGVDTHVHRISNRMGWVKGTKTPEDTRKALQDWLPDDYWNEINPLLVGFGQIHCLPILPKCDSCPIKDTCLKIGIKTTRKRKLNDE